MEGYTVYHGNDRTIERPCRATRVSFVLKASRRPWGTYCRKTLREFYSETDMVDRATAGVAKRLMFHAP